MSRPLRLDAFMAALVAGIAAYWHSFLVLKDAPDSSVYLFAWSQARHAWRIDVPGWYYPDFTAHLLSAVAQLIGDDSTFRLLRAGDLAGCAVVASVTAACVLPSRLCPLVAALLMLSDPVYWTVVAGNVAGLLTGLTVLAGLAAAPLAAEAFAMAAYAFKPYAIGLAVAVPWRRSWPMWVAAALAYLDGPSHRALSFLDTDESGALPRALREWGLPVPWQLWTVVVLAFGYRWARGRLDRALLVSYVALPVMWAMNGLLAFVPLGVATRAVLDRPWPTRSHRALALLSLAFAFQVACHPNWGLPDGPAWLSGLMGCVPTLSAAMVGWLCGPTGLPIAGGLNRSAPAPATE